MPTVINTAKRSERSLLDGALSEILPYKLFDEIIKRLSPSNAIEELRCRRDRRTRLTTAGCEIELSYICRADDMARMTERLCGGSLYAHMDTMLEGYVTLVGGVRVGICGRAAVEGGRMIGVYDVSSLCFRFPARRFCRGEAVCRLIREGGSVLVYSPPAVGKTTLLRSVAVRLSEAERPLRVAVVDTRGELSWQNGDERGTADILLGYPRSIGIEIATRTLNPQLIVCDEIGTRADAEAVLSAANCGVPLLASAHAGSVSELLRRPPLRELHEARIFSHYVGLSRRSGENEPTCTVTKREDADAFL